MKVKVRETPKVFDAEQFTVEHVLDPKNHPLPPGVTRKGNSEIFPELATDAAGKQTRRKPHERVGQHFHFMTAKDGSSQRVSVGDWILTDGNGDRKLVFKDNFAAAFQQMESEPEPEVASQPTGRPGRPRKAESQTAE